MLDKLAAIEAKYSQIEARLAAPETYDDPDQVAKLNKEQTELSPVVETYRQYLRAQQQKEESEALLSDPEMRELAQEEFQQARADLERLEGELKVLLLPRDPNGGRGGRPVRPLPVPHVLHVRRGPAVENGDQQRQRNGAGRREGDLLYHRGGRGLLPPEV